MDNSCGPINIFLESGYDNENKHFSSLILMKKSVECFLIEQEDWAWRDWGPRALQKISSE